MNESISSQKIPVISQYAMIKACKTASSHQQIEVVSIWKVWGNTEGFVYGLGKYIGSRVCSVRSKKKEFIVRETRKRHGSVGLLIEEQMLYLNQYSNSKA